MLVALRSSMPTAHSFTRQSPDSMRVKLDQRTLFHFTLPQFGQSCPAPITHLSHCCPGEKEVKASLDSPVNGPVGGSQNTSIHYTVSYLLIANNKLGSNGDEAAEFLTLRVFPHYRSLFHSHTYLFLPYYNVPRYGEASTMTSGGFLDATYAPLYFFSPPWHLFHNRTLLYIYLQAYDRNWRYFQRSHLSSRPELVIKLTRPNASTRGAIA